MGIAENIKKIRERFDLTQDELGEIAGVSGGAVSTWERGTAEPRMGAVQKIADKLNISKSDIVDDDSNVETYNAPAGARIPVYGCIPAGLPLEAIDCIDGYVDVPSEWLAKGDEYFGLRVKGDSMSPKYLDGDLIILRRQPDCESGQDAAVRVNGDEATLKKVVKLMDGIMLQPLNPEYTPRQYDYTDEFNPVEIMGVVVQLRRDV